MKTLLATSFDKQLAHFKLLIEITQHLDNAYQTDKPFLQLPHLLALAQQTELALKAWHEAETDWRRASSLRTEAFKQLNNYAQLLRKSIFISEVPAIEKELLLNTLQHLFRKKVRLAAPVPGASIFADTKKTSYKGVSIHQKLEVFSKFHQLLSQTPSYHSSFEAYSLQGVAATLSALKQHQENFDKATMALQHARSIRDQQLNHPSHGLISIGNRLKEWLKIYYRHSPTHLQTLHAIKLSKTYR